MEIGKNVQTKALFVPETKYTLAVAFVGAGKDHDRALRLAREAHQGQLEMGDERYANEIAEFIEAVSSSQSVH